LKILLLSDTHSYLDETILKYARESDEIWHAGDFGNASVSDTLAAIKPLKGVYGNIDGDEVRKIHPLENFFTCQGIKVLMIHIGGYPGKYPSSVRERIQRLQPDLFICGHSHLLKIIRDPLYNNMLCINPGAAGKNGFHLVRTMVRFKIANSRISDVEVIELGNRS
jgi:uncharacterized protein